MPWTSLTPHLVWVVIFVPLTILLFRVQIKDRLTPVLALLAYLMVNLYFYLAVNWALVSYWLRFLPILFAVAYVIRYLMTPLKHKPWLRPRTPQSMALWIVTLVLLVGAVAVNVPVLRSYSYPKAPVVLVQHPAQTGMYVVTNGGNGLDGLAMNDHYRDWMGRVTAADQSQIYAVDVVEIRTNGMMANEVQDTNLNNYEGSINEPLRSPCPGVVVHKDFSHRDVKPYATPSDPLGNRVVIQCVDYYVTVANLRQNQELVEMGEFLSFDRIIGYIGTSGTPSIPHVHIHATMGSWDETGIPVVIQFEGRPVVRNFLYIR
jgi:hypothetical protein